MRNDDDDDNDDDDIFFRRSRRTKNGAPDMISRAVRGVTSN